MRIDAQHSFSGQHPLDYLESILKRNRFDGSVLFASDIPAELPDFVKAVVVRMERIDPGRLEEYQRHPRFRGVCCSLPADGLEELESRGLTLDVAGGSEHLSGICDRFPSLRIAAGIADVGLGAPDGVQVKLLALRRLAGPRVVREALARYGPERLMFASNWPDELPETTWKAALALFTQSIGAQPIEVREQLLGGTAQRFYGI